jgi:hypothetical protein
MTRRESKAGAKSSARAENRKVDEQGEESFPASDPPAFMGGQHIVGAPKKRETPAPECAKPKK